MASTSSATKLSSAPQTRSRRAKAEAAREAAAVKHEPVAKASKLSAESVTTIASRSRSGSAKADKSAPDEANLYERSSNDSFESVKSDDEDNSASHAECMKFASQLDELNLFVREKNDSFLFF